MRISNIGNVNLLPNNINLENKKLNIPEEKIVIPSEIFIKSEIEDTILLYSKLTIENLEILPDTLFNNLKQMVKEMIVKQVQEFQVLDQKNLAEVNVSTIAEALELISPDGELGIEKLSNSIVDFAKKISGGDKTKLETLKEEIVKGFTETERILGKLPDISIKTRYKILEKLDTWEYGWIQRTMLNLQNPILPERITFSTLTPKILTPIILTGILIVIIFISLR